MIAIYKDIKNFAYVVVWFFDKNLEVFCKLRSKFVSYHSGISPHIEQTVEIGWTSMKIISRLPQIMNRILLL